MQLLTGIKMSHLGPRKSFSMRSERKTENLLPVKKYPPDAGIFTLAIATYLLAFMRNNFALTKAAANSLILITFTIISTSQLLKNNDNIYNQILHVCKNTRTINQRFLATHTRKILFLLCFLKYTRFYNNGMHVATKKTA